MAQAAVSFEGELMSLRPALVAASLCLGATGFPLCAAATTASKPVASTPSRETLPPPEHWKVLDQFCVKCHNTEDWAGGVAFDTADAAALGEDAQTWEKVIRKLRAGMMPPAG